MAPADHGIQMRAIPPGWGGAHVTPEGYANRYAQSVTDPDAFWGEVGKRLDFLIQELHREANTLGAKSAALELTRISVDMKVLIEQMREQVQNIE